MGFVCLLITTNGLISVCCKQGMSLACFSSCLQCMNFQELFFICQDYMFCIFVSCLVVFAWFLAFINKKKLFLQSICIIFIYLYIYIIHTLIVLWFVDLCEVSWLFLGLFNVVVMGHGSYYHTQVLD